MLEDLRVLGASPETIDEWRDQLEQQETEEAIVLPADCREVVALFLAVETQWNRLLAGDRLLSIGLNYPGAGEAWRQLGMPVTPVLFRDIQAMENEALAAMAERR